MNENLELFRHKVGCIHSQRKAYYLWQEIKPSLSSEEVSLIQTAWSHFLIGESRGELDEVINHLLERV